MGNMNDLELEYRIEEFPQHYKCEAICQDGSVCRCNISVDENYKVWTISAWYTKEEYKHQGIGKKTMQFLLQYLEKEFGSPDGIEYIWNGTNQYVYNWIHECFDAYCKCPIAIQKTQSDDDWSSHMYVLNKEKIFAYFCI